MPDIPPDTGVPARLRSVLIDALADIEQTRHRMEAAQEAATELERRIEAATECGLIAPDDRLFELTRTLASATHAAAAASLGVAQHVRKLR